MMNSDPTLPARHDELARWTLAAAAAMLTLSGILMVSTSGSGALWLGIVTLGLGLGALIVRLRAAGDALSGAPSGGRQDHANPEIGLERSGRVRTILGGVLRGALAAVIFGALVGGLKLILTSTGDAAVASYAAFGIVLLVASPVLDRVA